MTTFIADESTNFPYSAVTYVEAIFPDGTRVSGSGAVVGINDVLTAAHVVYSPENGGLDSGEFTQQLASRGGGDSALVETLYWHVLEREPDAEGRDFWLDELASGQLKPAELVLAFTASDEYVAASHSLVQGAKLLLWGPNLERLDPAELGFDMASFERAQESAESLVRLYHGILDRMPDPDGFDYWLEETDQGASLAAIADAFFLSDEFLGGLLEPAPEDAVESLYRNVLAREPDAPAYDFWIAEMQADDFGFGDLALSFTESREFVAASQARVDDFMLDHYRGGLVGEPLPLDEYLFG